VFRIFAVVLLMPLSFSVVFAAQDAEEPVFSGPQIGEALPPLPVEILSGERIGAKVDLVDEFGEKPSVIFFIHQLTRPGFGLMRTITGFAANRSLDGKSPGDADQTDPNSDKLSTRRDAAGGPKMPVGVVFLTADKTETVQWAANVNRLFSRTVTYAVSPDGIEGPGAFGLNRNVILTVLVCQDKKVVSNFALVQPQLQADGPAMLESIVNVTGGGEVPSIESLVGEGPGMMRERPAAGNPRANAARPQTDPELGNRLRGVISRSASEEEVLSRAAEIEQYLEQHPEGKKEIARIVNTIINAGKLENYGTAAAQKVLAGWKEKYSEFAPKVDPPTRN
jgi:hypothetical protein